MTTETAGTPHRVRTAEVSAIVGGTGVPVLLLHGIGGNAHSFDTLAALLASTHRTIAWDAPGYGDSPDPVRPPGVAGYLGAVAELLTATGGSAHIVGTSWGGVIATYLAARRPDLVRSLTLLDSTRGSAVDPARAEAMRARPADLQRSGATEFARQRAGRLPAPNAPAVVRSLVEHHMAQIRVPGYRGAAEFMASADTGPLLATITPPALVLVGEHDRITGVPESQLLAARIPGARFATVPDAGHSAVQEQPQLIADLLTEFFDDVERSTVEANA